MHFVEKSTGNFAVYLRLFPDRNKIKNAILAFVFASKIKRQLDSIKVLINNDFLKHKQANIIIKSRRFGIVMTPFSRQNEISNGRFDFYSLFKLA